MKKVLIVCTHNSSRSQMAEGLINNIHFSEIKAYSAGTEPSEVSPYAIQALNSIGIDISSHTSKHIEQFIDEEFDLVVTVCDSAQETCPVFPGAIKKIHKSFEDPNSAPVNNRYSRFCEIRDEIRLWVENELPSLID